MKSRDEILAAMHEELFSTRHKFFEILNQFSRRLVGQEYVQVRWPDALTVITLDEWNRAYAGALAWKAGRIAERASDSGPEQSSY